MWSCGGLKQPRYDPNEISKMLNTHITKRNIWYNWKGFTVHSLHENNSSPPLSLSSRSSLKIRPFGWVGLFERPVYGNALNNRRCIRNKELFLTMRNNHEQRRAWLASGVSSRRAPRHDHDHKPSFIESSASPETIGSLTPSKTWLIDPWPH